MASPAKYDSKTTPERRLLSSGRNLDRSSTTPDKASHVAQWTSRAESEADTVRTLWSSDMNTNAANGKIHSPSDVRNPKSSNKSFGLSDHESTTRSGFGQWPIDVGGNADTHEYFCMEKPRDGDENESEFNSKYPCDDSRIDGPCDPFNTIGGNEILAWSQLFKKEESSPLASYLEALILGQLKSLNVGISGLCDKQKSDPNSVVYAPHLWRTGSSIFQSIASDRAHGNDIEVLRLVDPTWTILATDSDDIFSGIKTAKLDFTSKAEQKKHPHLCNHFPGGSPWYTTLRVVTGWDFLHLDCEIRNRRPIAMHLPRYNALRTLEFDWSLHGSANWWALKLNDQHRTRSKVANPFSPGFAGQHLLIPQLRGASAKPNLSYSPKEAELLECGDAFWDTLYQTDQFFIQSDPFLEEEGRGISYFEAYCFPNLAFSTLDESTRE